MNMVTPASLHSARARGYARRVLLEVRWLGSYGAAV